MTDEYRPGRGHPISVDKDKSILTYSDELHGTTFYIMCPKHTFLCKNDEVLVNDYAEHLRLKHNVQIDPQPERLIKRPTLNALRIGKSRQGKYVWAPFPIQLPETIYEKHLEEIIKEKERTII